MNGHGTLDPRMAPRRVSGRLLFVLSLWMSLATAIVCAVVPAGLPSTRSVGSAFDPSTTIVALRSRPPVAARAAILRPDDGGRFAIDGAGGAAMLLAVAPAAILAIATAARSEAAATPFHLPARATDSARYARPPPQS